MKYPVTPIIIVLFLSFTFLSCSALLPKASQKKIFILAYSAAAECPDSQVDTPQINESDSVPQFHTNKIWFQKGPELGYYQFAEWSEPVTDRIARIIKDAANCNQLSLPQSSRLDFSVLNFTHNAETQPGELSLVIRVSLKMADGQQKDKSFKYSEKLASYDVSGVVEASDEVIRKFLKDLQNL